MRRWTRVSLIGITLGVIIGFAAGIIISLTNGSTSSQENPGTPAPTLAPPPADELSILDAEEAATAMIYDQAGPSVMHITSLSQTYDFFRGAVPQEGTGSGFVYDTQGHIVTNNHVVQDATQITVVLADGTSLTADVVGADSYYDLAVIHVDPAKLNAAPLPLAEGEVVRVGQKVLAIGNPFGLDRTLTTGIVSALGRTIEFAVGIGYRERHPNGRGHQPRQLGRAAAEHARTGDRREHRHPIAVGRIGRHRICRADQHSHPGRAGIDRAGPFPAPDHRRHRERVGLRSPAFGERSAARAIDRD